MKIGRTLLIVSVVSLLNDISSEMIYPLMPFFLASLGGGGKVVGLIEGAAGSLSAVIRLASGWFSDLIRRRKELTILGYGGGVAGKILLAIAGAWWVVLVARLIERFGKGIRTSPRDALIADTTAPEDRGKAFGFHQMMDNVGAVIGVVIAYFVLARIAQAGGAGSPDAYRSALWLGVVPAAAALLLLFLVREPASPPEAKPDGALQAFRHPVAAWRSLSPKLRRYLLVVLLFELGNSSNLFLLMRAENLGFAKPDVVLLYLVFNVVAAAAAYQAGHWSDRFGRRRLLIAGYGLYGATYLGFAAAGGLATGASHACIWGLFALYGLYSAFTGGVEKALITDLAPRELRATMLGLHAMVLGLALLPASVLAGALWDWAGPAAPFWLGGVLGVSAACALWKTL
ncbi:MAG: MFS transporter [Phycisphaerales bacterium]|nr:MFS transporter [Phycisphaerales bacterium]